MQPTQPDPLAKYKPTTAEEAAKIFPRAEFRVFGRDIVEGIKERMWNAKAQLKGIRDMPEEVYFLSRNTNDVNVKVRGGLLDIKTKVGETPEGYEIFQPQGKFNFPVSRGQLAEILEHLKVSMPLNQDQYSIEEFIEMARDNPEMAVIQVTKRRYGFMIEDIMCEYAYVYFNGAMLETACCEGEDYSRIKDAVDALGIGTLPNTNYLKAAKQVLGII